jgi:hypothetical protein
MDKLFLPLMALGLVSPLLAIMAAFIFFFRHRERAAPNGRVSAIGYIIAIIFFAAVGGFVGVTIGLQQACPRMGNLCGLCVLHHRPDRLFARNFVGWDCALSNHGRRGATIATALDQANCRGELSAEGVDLFA